MPVAATAADNRPGNAENPRRTIAAARQRRILDAHPATCHPARMVHHPIIEGARPCADEPAPERITMHPDTATRAHKAISLALGATTYRDTEDDALSVAVISCGTVVTERTADSLQVTLQRHDGETWSLVDFPEADTGDVYGVLVAALNFIGRHNGTAADDAPDTVDCPYCSGDGSPHCTHLPAVDTECPDCGGDGIIPAIGCDEKYVPCFTCTN